MSSCQEDVDPSEMIDEPCDFRHLARQPVVIEMENWCCRLYQRSGRVASTMERIIEKAIRKFRGNLDAETLHEYKQALGWRIGQHARRCRSCRGAARLEPEPQIMAAYLQTQLRQMREKQVAGRIFFIGVRQTLAHYGIAADNRAHFAAQCRKLSAALAELETKQGLRSPEPYQRARRNKSS